MPRYGLRMLGVEGTPTMYFAAQSEASDGPGTHGETTAGSSEQLEKPLPFRRDDLLEGYGEHLRELECERQARVVSGIFDGIHGLSRDVQPSTELGL